MNTGTSPATSTAAALAQSQTALPHPALPWVALGVALVLLALAALHLYWALGGQKGLAAAIPTLEGQPLLDPRWWQSAGVGVALVWAAGWALAQGGWWSPPWPASYSRWGCMGLAAVFALRAIGDFKVMGLFKREKNSLFGRWDARLYTPLSFALAYTLAWMAH